jgi:APA family basic amino acid/polyamine antiporter
MARDGLFFRTVASVHPRTHVPVVAIVLQGALATVIALSGRYEQILNYVVSVDFIFFGLTAVSLLILRQRAERTGEPRPRFRAPGHPFTPVGFVAAAWLVVASAVVRFPSNTVIGLSILLAGVPVYFLWRGRGGHVGA